MAKEKKTVANPPAAVPVPNQALERSGLEMNLVQKVLLYSFLFAFALFNWFLFLGIALKSGLFFTKPTEEEEQQLASARDRLWNLSKQPVPGFRHGFYKIRSGHQLHFVTNQDPNGTKTPGDLVVFLHGFPDSSMIWRYVLQKANTSSNNATLVCVDLPGYGGSDSFKKYDARVLDALTEFIVAMRERYTQDANGMTEGRTYVCGHDWGCVLTLRLATEAPGLADRFITSNGPLLSLTRANSEDIVRSSLKIFKQFRAAPTKNFRLLKKSWLTFKPLLIQLMLSGYIFAFNLPGPMVKYLGSGGYQSFPRGVADRQYGKSKPTSTVQETLGSLRPGPKECKSSLPTTAESYGPSVVTRASAPGLAFNDMCGYYRNGLSYIPWEKSIETVADLYNLENSMSAARQRRSSSTSAALSNERFKGSLKAPMTMLWALDDLALSKAVNVDGIGDYLFKDSEVIFLPRSGHWTPLEAESIGAWAKILATLLDTPHGQDPPVSMIKGVQSVYPDAHVFVRR